jgi:hypothetical protein
MRFAFRRPAVVSFGVSTAAYLIGVACAGGVTTYAAWRGGEAALRELAAVVAPSVPAKSQASGTETGPVSPHVEGSMTPLADWEDRAPPPRFGASARNPYQSRRDPRFFGDDGDEDDDRPRLSGAYRTVCVRLCDGYYFPIGFAVTPERFARDRSVCESSCSGQGRLFVQRSLDGSADDMVDLQGRPYRQLPTAFRYRSEYVPSCKCRPDPWEAASLDRHRAYALAAAARKGNKDAAKELQALQSKAREAARTAATAPPTDAGAAAAARQAEIAGREDGGIMGLGSDGAPKPRAEREPEAWRVKRERDWIGRAFETR